MSHEDCNTSWVSAIRLLLVFFLRIQKFSNFPGEESKVAASSIQTLLAYTLYKLHWLEKKFISLF